MPKAHQMNVITLKQSKQVARFVLHLICHGKVLMDQRTTGQQLSK